MNQYGDTLTFTYSTPTITMRCETDLGSCSKMDPCGSHYNDIEHDEIKLTGFVNNGALDIEIIAAEPFNAFKYETLIVGFEMFFRNGMVDTTYNLGSPRAKHLQTVVLNGIEFKDVYTADDTFKVNYYFNRQLGIVGYTTLSDTIWSLKP